MPAMAKCNDKWIETKSSTTSKGNKNRLYFSECNLKKNGENRIGSVLMNLKNSNPKGHKSAIFDVEYDCSNHRARAVFVKLFSELNGKGKLIEEGSTTEYKQNQWADISENSSQSEIYKSFCAMDLKKFQQIKSDEYQQFLGRHSVNLTD